MKIIDPNLPTNKIFFISRFEAVTSATTGTTVSIYNPNNKTNTDITSGITFGGLAGISHIEIPQSAYTFVEDVKVKITVANEEILFMGDILPTSQPNDTYKLTTNKYEYR